MTDTQIEVNPAFQGAGEQPGMEIWRVEQFEPVRQDPKTYGKFYNGDAYILLNSVQEQGSNKLHYDLHFWLGKNSSQDEQGSAAMLTVELDQTVLRGSAVQCRETQSHESKLFLSYFKNGLQYLEGGVDSGFNTYDPTDYIKRLFQVKGKNNVRIEQVECKCGSLNQGDAFVLDDGPDIWAWIGPHSEKKEQLGAVEYARALRDGEKAGRAHIHVVEEDWETNEGFFTALGSKDKAIKAADLTPDDDIVRDMDQNIVLYSIEPPKKEGDKATIEEIGQRPLQQDMLDSDNCYVLDSGYSGIYIWTGKNTESDFKKKVWHHVNEFMDQRGYPEWVTVTRVVDGGETPLFKQYFESWEDPWTKDEGQQSNVAKTDYTGAEGIDIEDLHSKPSTVEQWMPDDGSGTLQVFRVDSDLELAPVVSEVHGVFFGGDCYVMDYAYGAKDKASHIIYFWQGLKSGTDAKGASAAHAVALDQKYNGEAVQVRVVMNKEPAHFMKMFKGRIIIFEGGHITTCKSLHDRADYRPEDTYMFQIRGQTTEETRAIQVAARGASLNANDVFIVDSLKKTYVWVGNYCSEPEKEMAKLLVEHVTPKGKGDPEIIQQGNETQTFWNVIDGEEPYYDAERKNATNARIPSRLFHCSNASGKFTVEEIVAFVQQDLDEGSIFILDTYDEIFVWVGDGANEFEKKESYKTAYSYLETDPTGRTQDNTLIIVVRMGSEPPVFTGSFLAWDFNLWSEGKTFHEIIDDVGKENAGINLLEDEHKKYTSFYPLEVLQRNPPPEGVDVMRKEMYLEDEEFKEVFEMTKEKYLEKPEWKRNELRKQHGLF